MTKKKIDLLRDSPVYTQVEAARYLGLPKSTLRYWAFGESTSRRSAQPLIRTPQQSNQLSFLNLVELHVLCSIRREYEVELAKIRALINYVKQKLGLSRPLLEETFETDGVSLFVERYGRLLNVSEGGQQAMKQLIQGSLKRIKRDKHRIPIKLFPYTRTQLRESPAYISMTPELFSGRPVIDGTGLSTLIIAERYKAGESVDELCTDYGISRIQIEEALRCELQKAA